MRSTILLHSAFMTTLQINGQPEAVILPLQCSISGAAAGRTPIQTIYLERGAVYQLTNSSDRLQQQWKANTVQGDSRIAALSTLDRPTANQLSSDVAICDQVQSRSEQITTLKSLDAGAGSQSKGRETIDATTIEIELI